eukprot:UN28886
MPPKQRQRLIRLEPNQMPVITPPKMLFPGQATRPVNVLSMAPGGVSMAPGGVLHERKITDNRPIPLKKKVRYTNRIPSVFRTKPKKPNPEPKSPIEGMTHAELLKFINMIESSSDTSTSEDEPLINLCIKQTHTVINGSQSYEFGAQQQQKNRKPHKIRTRGQKRKIDTSNDASKSLET